MSELSIRRASAADADVLIAFNQRMAAETEGRALADDVISPGVRAVLSDRSRGRYFVALRDEAIVGQMMVTFEWSDWRNANFWWIQSVYVTQAQRRAGVYRALHARAEAEAREDGACGLRLYVEKSNEGAQATYRALGMAPCHYDMFEIEFAG